MTRRALWTVAAIAATVLAGGCKGADDEYAPAFVPKTYAFEGKLEPKYVGAWVSADGSSTLGIVKDGGLKIDTASRSVAGKSLSHVAGQWLASGGTLMFRYTVGSQAPTVLKYSATLSGNTLTLQQADGRAKTTYKRK